MIGDRWSVQVSVPSLDRNTDGEFFSDVIASSKVIFLESVEPVTLYNRPNLHPDTSQVKISILGNKSSFIQRFKTFKRESLV